MVTEFAIVAMIGNWLGWWQSNSKTNNIWPLRLNYSQMMYYKYCRTRTLSRASDIFVSCRL